jgi:hypothetical protein
MAEAGCHQKCEPPLSEVPLLDDYGSLFVFAVDTLKRKGAISNGFTTPGVETKERQ